MQAAHTESLCTQVGTMIACHSHSWEGSLACLGVPLAVTDLGVKGPLHLPSWGAAEVAEVLGRLTSACIE